ncbi:hypothetical protein RV10_GL004414 [Enterococcus pallens]|nr:hypothetical protein RV10_GL004414 [Enterococcus pallens]
MGSGWIAHEMGEALTKVNGEIYGVYDISADMAKKFAEEYAIQQVFTSEKEFLEDKQIEIVYVATPHNLHYEWMKKALLAGKHVFVEKVITVNNQQLEECIAIAEQQNLVIMEGMTLYHMPLFSAVKERLQSGELGKVKMVQVNFGSCKEYDVTHRFFSKELAGGALLDIGVYAVSFARFFLAETPNVVLSTVNYFETGVDEEAGILMKNALGQLVVIALTMRAKQAKRGTIIAEKGYIEIENYPRADQAKIVFTEDNRVEEIVLGHSGAALEYEVAAIQKYITENKSNDTLAWSLDVNRLLTEIRNLWGFKYPFE